jgi:hypothetical protein
MFTLPATGANIRPTNFVKLVRICCIFLLMTTISARAAEDSVEKLAKDSRCVRGLAWIDKNSAWLTERQIQITEIPAP